VQFPKLRTKTQNLRTAGRSPIASRCALGAAFALAFAFSFALTPACSSDSSSNSNGNSTAGTSPGGSAQAGANATGGSLSSGGSASSGAGTAGSIANGGVANGGTSGSIGAGAGGTASAGAGASGASGSAGASGAGGATACVMAGSELCEDFESGTIDPNKWKQSTSNMTSIAVETGHAHSGQYAVHLKFVAGMQNTVTIAEGVTFPATPNKFYSRMWAYFAPDIPKATNMDFHTGFMMGGGNNDKGTTTLGMGMIGSDQQYLGYSIFFGDPKYEFGPWSNTRIVPNTWLCIELFEDGSDLTTEKRQVWLNDVELKDIASDSAKAGGTTNPNHLPPTFDKVTFGVTEYHPIPTLSDMWIDDIRVSSQKIGCMK
jgi:hypothetical protein